ncbi:MAG TPA: GTP 3',8-cyclase MoaA, partial [Polyangiales bacterium]|nr:GTP 3',8-cyclase MoaA [Polyangiales bacterium]
MRTNEASRRVLDQLQRPLRDLRVSVTDRCNFRCDYCMPAAIYSDESRFHPQAELLSFSEIERVVSTAIDELGVSKLRLTGGEPLLRPNLPLLIARLSRLRGLDEVTLTTNGSRLSEHASALRDAGLSRLTISLDSLDPAEFARMSGGKHDLARVLAGIDAAERVGFDAIKLNCVVVRGRNEGAILTLAERFRGSPHIVRFIEYMDVGTQNRWQASEVVSAREIVERIAARWPIQPIEPNYRGEVAQRFRYLDGAGEVGVISSISDPFCGSCHRARLSADGRLLTCLFAADGVSLKQALRDGAGDAALSGLLREIWSKRSDRYSEERAGLDRRHQRR